MRDALRDVLRDVTEAVFENSTIFGVSLLDVLTDAEYLTAINAVRIGKRTKATVDAGEEHLRRATAFTRPPERSFPGAEKLTDEERVQRQLAKVINFGPLYGVSLGDESGRINMGGGVAEAEEVYAGAAGCLEFDRAFERVQAFIGGVEPVLCYVEGQWAYFTTQRLQDQWGDDWDDAPYEHNAGEPYKDERWGEAPEDQNRWQIVKVAYFGPFEEPREHFLNSPFSVRDINNERCPWLVANPEGKTVDSIHAGATLGEFLDFILGHGGEVFTSVDRRWVPPERGCNV